MQPSCVICNSSPRFTCGQCRSVSYCSDLCQATDWTDIHSKICQIGIGEKRERDVPVIIFESFTSENGERQTIQLPLGVELGLDDFETIKTYNMDMKNQADSFRVVFYQENNETYVYRFKEEIPIYYTPERMQTNPQKLSIGDRLQFLYPDPNFKCDPNVTTVEYSDEEDDGPTYVEIKKEPRIVCNPVFQVIQLPQIDTYFGAFEEQLKSFETNFPNEMEMREMAALGQYNRLSKRLKQLTAQNALKDAVNRNPNETTLGGLDRNIWLKILLEVDVRTLLDMIQRIPFIGDIVYRREDEFWRKRIELDFPELMETRYDLSYSSIFDKTYITGKSRGYYMVMRYFIRQYRKNMFHDLKISSFEGFEVTFDFSKSPEIGTKTIRFLNNLYKPITLQIGFESALGEFKKNIRNYLSFFKQGVKGDGKIAFKFFTRFLNYLFLARGESPPVFQHPKMKVGKTLQQMIEQGFVYKDDDGKMIIGNLSQ